MNKKRLILCFIPFVNVIFWYIITMKNSHKMTKGWQFKIILCMFVSGIVGSVLLLAIKAIIHSQTLFINFALYYLFSLIIVIPQIFLHEILIKK